MTHPARHFAWCTLHIYKLNKQGDNIQPWHTPFPIWNQSVLCPVLNCCFLTCKQISLKASKVIWYFHLFKNFPQCVVIHTVQGFYQHSQWIRCFSRILLRSVWSNGCWQFDLSGSSAFSKPSLNIWKFLVHVLLKPGLENFEHYFASMWDEYDCALSC